MHAYTDTANNNVYAYSKTVIYNSHKKSCVETFIKNEE